MLLEAQKMRGNSIPGGFFYPHFNFNFPAQATELMVVKNYMCRLGAGVCANHMRRLY